jgi:hypothetical protein
VLALARPPKPAPRKATFEEIGERVAMTLALPGLIPLTDQEAIDSVDSNLDNTLTFTLQLREYKTRQVLVEQTINRKIRHDPWKKKYVVSTQSGKGWSKRYFDKRDEAIEFAVTLSRVRISDTADLERGDNGPYYYVDVVAMRNPIKRRARRRGSSYRSRGRDLEWLDRLVNVLAGERALAEQVVRIKTNAFYLLPR